MTIASLRRDLRYLIKMVLQEQPQPISTSRKKLMQYSFSPKNANGKVETYCGRCRRAIFNELKLILCTTCYALE